jgi:hypothetical protein
VHISEIVSHGWYEIHKGENSIRFPLHQTIVFLVKIAVSDLERFRSTLLDISGEEGARLQYHALDQWGAELRWVQSSDLIFDPTTAALLEKYCEDHVYSDGKPETHRRSDKRVEGTGGAKGKSKKKISCKTKYKKKATRRNPSSSSSCSPS